MAALSLNAGMDGGRRNEDWQAVHSAVSVPGANIGVHLAERSFTVITGDLLTRWEAELADYSSVFIGRSFTE
jgi:hypothetical protein